MWPQTPFSIKISMIPRLKKRSEFLTTSKSGVSVRRESLILVCYIREHQSSTLPDETIRIGFTASKRVGNSVIRNRCKRRLRAMADKLLQTTVSDVIKLRKITLNEKAFDFVMIATPRTPTVPFSVLCQDFSRAIELCIDRTMSSKNFTNNKIGD
jgi:ribonuclease P protein component